MKSKNVVVGQGKFRASKFVSNLRRLCKDANWAICLHCRLQSACFAVPIFLNACFGDLKV